MTSVMKNPLVVGSGAIALVGIGVYVYQLLFGLGITGMNNSTSWVSMESILNRSSFKSSLMIQSTWYYHSIIFITVIKMEPLLKSAARLKKWLCRFLSVSKKPSCKEFRRPQAAE